MEHKRKRALVLINNTSGIGRAGATVLEIARRLAERDYEPIVYPIVPGSPLVSEKLLEEYGDQVDLVLCSGGDGTLNHVIQSIVPLEHPPLLSYIPAGSTNDFAKALGIPTEFDAALEVAVGDHSISYDIGKLNDRYFNYVAAFGAFSAVSYATDQQLKNVLGHAAYIVSAVADLPQNIGYSCHMEIELEDSVIEDDFVFGAVSNTVSMGGFEMYRGMDIRLGDGKMELLLIRAPKNPLDLQGILAALSSGNLNQPSIIFRQITSAVIRSGSDTAWSLDGEFGGSYGVATISVLERAVTILAGDGTSDRTAR